MDIITDELPDIIADELPNELPNGGSTDEELDGIAEDGSSARRRSVAEGLLDDIATDSAAEAFSAVAKLIGADNCSVESPI